MNPFQHYEEWRSAGLSECLEITALLQRSDVSCSEIISRLKSTAAILETLEPAEQTSLFQEDGAIAWVDGTPAYSEAEFDRLFAQKLGSGSTIVGVVKNLPDEPA